MSKLVVAEIEDAAGSNPYSITLGTESTTTGGATLDFTGIPSGTKLIRVNIIGMSRSGTSQPILQLGDADGIETSGYVSKGISVDSGTQEESAATNGLILATGTSANDLLSGTCTLCLEDSSNRTWSMTCVIADETEGRIKIAVAHKSLSAELTQIRFTTAGGSETVDANGGINIQFQ
jgi:hypothetical protein